jgi:hypothetical protein
MRRDGGWGVRVSAFVKRLDLWTAAVLLTAIWHAARGAPMETIVFVGAVIAMLAGKGARKKPAGAIQARMLRLHEPFYQRLALTLLVANALLTLVLPWHGWWHYATLAFIGLLAMLLMWPDSSTLVSDMPESSAASRATGVWSLWLLLFLLWEMAAYILAEMVHNDEAYPTITVIVAPAIAGFLGHLTFTVGWLAVGWLVFGKVVKP